MEVGFWGLPIGFCGIGGLCTTVDGGSYGWIWVDCDGGVVVMGGLGLGGCVPLRRCYWFVGLSFTMDGCSCIGLLLVVHQ